MYLQKFHQGIEHCLSVMAFVCHEYYKAFHWTIFLHVSQCKGLLAKVGCIRCRIQRDGVVFDFLTREMISPRTCSPIILTSSFIIVDVCVSLAAISLSFDILCKKVAYWAMSSRIPRKFPFLCDLTNSLSPLNAKSRLAINLITLTTRFNTGLQYCSRRSSL